MKTNDVKPKRVRIELPLRIDLAGGWSDTPPICYDNGGSVLNAAILLNGKCPVVADVRRIAEREVRVESVDLGKRGKIRPTGALWSRAL